MEGRDWMGPGGDVTQRDGGAFSPGRKQGQHLTPEEREAFGHEAVLLHAEGLTYRQIAREIGVHYNTVGGLIREEYERRKATRGQERSRALAVYRRRQADGWGRLKVLPTGSTAQNVTGMHNAIRQEQERIDKITGIEAPTKSEHTRRVVEMKEVLPAHQLEQLAEMMQECPDAWNLLLVDDD